MKLFSFAAAPVAWVAMNGSPAFSFVAEAASHKSSSGSGITNEEVESAFRQAMGRALGVSSSGNMLIGLSALVAVGGIVTVGKYGLRTVMSSMLNTVTINAHFDSRDEAYFWILNWVILETSKTRGAGTFIVSANAFKQLKHHGAAVMASETPSVHVSPGKGTHWLKFRGKWLFVSRGGSQKSDTLTVRLVALNRDILHEFLAFTGRLFSDKDKNRTRIYSVGDHCVWNQAASRMRRPLSSVVLREGVSEGLVEDMREFLGSEAWYSARGIPWRRGYLLYGKPGNGKTSFITALAGELGLSIYNISLNSPCLTDSKLSELMTEAKRGSILLLEDIEVNFGAEHPSGGKLTMSGLLNAIDGVSSQEGRLLFVTTNHPESLPDNLVRPGRIDFKTEFLDADSEQTARLYSNFYPGVEEAKAREFASGLVAGDSMAQIQGFLMKYKNEPEKALAQWMRRSREGPKAAAV